jgi:hypothetical protein
MTVACVMKSAWLARTVVICAPIRFAMCSSIAWSKALSSVAITAQLGLVRQAAFVSRLSKADMLIGTCESRRNAASASLTSWAKPALNFAGLR